MDDDSDSGGGAPSVYALTDTEQEAGIASDSKGRVCNFGPSHDECHDQYLGSTAYQSGFKHGVADANLREPTCAPGQFPCPPPTDYILQPGQGFADHTTAFVDGYIKGWCLVNHGGGIDVNDDENPPTVASFDCDKGLSSAYPSPSDWPN